MNPINPNNFFLLDNSQFYSPKKINNKEGYIQHWAETISKAVFIAEGRTEIATGPNFVNLTWWLGILDSEVVSS